MASEFRVWKHRVPQGVDLEPLDRITGRDGSRLVEADVTSIDVVVYNVQEKTAILTRSGLSPTLGTDAETRVYDTLQTDGRWTPDNIGYNAKTVVTKAMLDAVTQTLEGGKRYRVEIKYVTTAWGDLYTVHEYTIDTLYQVV